MNRVGPPRSGLPTPEKIARAKSQTATLVTDLLAKNGRKGTGADQDQMIERKFVIVELPEGSKGTVEEAITALQKQGGAAWRTRNVGKDLAEVRAPILDILDALEVLIDK